MTHFKLHTILFLLLFNTACGDKEESNDNDGAAGLCDASAIIDINQYDEATAEELEISKLEIDQDCLNITLTSNGCDGSSWIVKLITDGSVAESLPPQRFMKIDFKNNEECDAVVSSVFSFDISKLKTDSPSVRLNFVGLDPSILYEY